MTIIIATIFVGAFLLFIAWIVKLDAKEKTNQVAQNKELVIDNNDCLLECQENEEYCEGIDSPEYCAHDYGSEKCYYCEKFNNEEFTQDDVIYRNGAYHDHEFS